MNSNQNNYLPIVGFIFVFNLIVGTGALTMPIGFEDAGWFLALIVVIVLALIGYTTVTFVIEAMSSANAILKITSLQSLSCNPINQASNSHLMEENVLDLESSFKENVPLIGDKDETKNFIFDITNKVELGKMAVMFFPSRGVKILYLVMAIYLYGDLAIYATTISKSLRDVTCTFHSNSLSLSEPCWTSLKSLSRSNVYRIYLGLTFLLLGPFTFLNVQKTKHLQIFTSLLRWIAFISMITLASIALIERKGKGQPQAFNIKGLPNLFGISVYSFMCHHSLPSLITPFKTKKNIHFILLMDYVLIFLFYILLSFTGIFTFPRIQKLYTLNFQESESADGIIYQIKVLEYLLPLFPVFTSGANFPIIAITLTNNIKTLFFSNNDDHQIFNENNQKILNFIFPFFSLIIPFIISMISEDIEALVSIVGGFAGVSIQYIIPAFLVYYSRQKVETCLKDFNLSISDLVIRKQLKSPFKSQKWIGFVLFWAFICISLLAINHIIVWTS